MGAYADVVVGGGVMSGELLSLPTERFVSRVSSIRINGVVRLPSSISDISTSRSVKPCNLTPIAYSVIAHGNDRQL
jgi:hypothetical protein